MFFVQNLWRDEAFSVVMSGQSVGNIIQSTAADFNPPLYYLILHYWMLIFGSSEIAIRSLSLLFYTLTIFVIFEMIVLVFKVPFKRAFLYGALILLNPTLLYYGFEARMYIMATFFVTLSFFALWTKRKKLYVVAITFALYTHYFTVFVLLAQILSQTNIFELKISIRQMAYKLIITPVILLLPWLIYLFTQHDFSSREFWVLVPPVGDLLYLPLNLYTGYERIFGQYYHLEVGYADIHTKINLFLIFILTMPFLLKKLVPKKLRKNTVKLPIFAILLWAFLPPFVLYFISIFSTPMYHPRYFMFASVGLILLLVISFEYWLLELRYFDSKFNLISQILAHKSLKKLHLSFTPGVLLFAAIFLSLILFTQKYNSLNLKYHSKRNVSGIYYEIQQLKNPKDVVYLTNELDYFLAKYYLKSEKQIIIFDIPYNKIPAFVGKVLIPPSSITSQIPNYPQRAFILHYDWYELRSQI